MGVPSLLRSGLSSIIMMSTLFRHVRFPFSAATIVFSALEEREKGGVGRLGGDGCIVRMVRGSRRPVQLANTCIAGYDIDLSPPSARRLRASEDPAALYGGSQGR